jgi:hypothetical protein
MQDANHEITQQQCLTTSIENRATGDLLRRGYFAGSTDHLAVDACPNQSQPSIARPVFDCGPI